MRARRFTDVSTLLATPEFRAWFGALNDAREAQAVARERHEELLAQLNLMEFRAELAQKNAIDTLYRAGEQEDGAARLMAESQELENRGFPGVAAFEEQRFKVSELWYQLGAAEKKRDEAREGSAALSALPALDRRVAEARAHYERELAQRNRLWDEVERLWARSAEVALVQAEHREQAKKTRKKSEALFGTAEDRKQQAKRFQADTDGAARAVETARATVEHLRSTARELFGCTPGEDFLYFRDRDDARHAFAVALVDDAESYNIEVEHLTVYSVDQRRGVSHLEPAVAQRPSLAEGDRRFEAYFLSGRKGEQRAP